MATRSRIRGLMCSTSINSTRFYDRDVSAALNIRRPPFKSQVSEVPQTSAAYQRLVKAKEDGEALEVTVRSCNAGGLLCVVLDVIGFMPYAELAASTTRAVPQTDMEYLIGQKLQAKVLEVDLTGEKKRVLLSEKQARRGEALQRLKVGDVMRGVVTGTAEYGAFVDLVDLPGVTGLVKKAELSWDRLVTADDAVQIGQQVTVKIIGLDAAKGRLTLSIRQLNEDPLKTTLDTVKWGPTKSVPTEVQQLADRLSRCKGISQVIITRQAQDTHRISQELQVFMTRTEMSDGFVVVARLGPVLQELQLTTSLSRDDVKQILQGIFKDA
ncbi:hypothetical protein QJQ45_011787 [Haematococcus lacustris]|nr:hypothetical protein QJQ45_011787 [Haematococcus lacustris]